MDALQSVVLKEDRRIVEERECSAQNTRLQGEYHYPVIALLATRSLVISKVFPESDVFVVKMPTLFNDAV